MNQKPKLLLALIVSLAVPVALAAQTREQKVRGDKAKVEADGFWIYNDLAKGFAEAKKSGKPLVVVLRCIPCEECVKLDDDLVDQDERLQAAARDSSCACGSFRPTAWTCRCSSSIPTSRSRCSC